jgi:ABC-type uncharacterized transport system involved in gliding motility auxiliary subunit
MNSNWRRFAPISLYITLAALLVAAGFFIVQGEFNQVVQISLGVAVIGLAVFTAMDPGRVRKLFSGRQARYGSNIVILTIAFLGILVVVNYLGYTYTQRWDLTADKENTLSSDTLEVLDSLSGPVKAVAFYTPELSSANAESLLDQYAFNSNGNLTYEFVDPVSEPALAQESGITQDGTILFTLGENKQLVTTISETEITSALIRLKNPGGRNVYFLAGHGEFAIDGGSDETLTRLVSELETKNYTVNSLNLMAEAQIPLDANVVVIAGPMQPVTETEVQLIDEYLKNGGTLIVLSEPPVMTDFGDKADPLADYLSENYGVVLGNDVVVDLDAADMINQPFVAISAQFSSHVITENMGNMATFFPTARSITLTEVSTSISQISLILTTQNAWAETNLESFKDSTLQPDEGVDLFGPLTLAVAIEDLSSGAKLVVFGDSEFPLNANYEVYGNGMMMVNAVDWAAGEEDLINLSSGTTTERYLNLSNPYLSGFVLFGSIVVIPGLVILAGIITWIQRKRRG